MLTTTLPVLALLAVANAAASYAPKSVSCPGGSLVRAASGLSDNEEAYRVARKAVADVALKKWLHSTNTGFGTNDLPTVALTTSGGGYRSLLCGAGVIQGLDGRDSQVSTSGLYQALTYQAGLSGGSWLLSSLAGNNYPTVSHLRDNLWEDAFKDSLFFPNGLLFAQGYADLVEELHQKNDAGFHTTLTDPWGKLLSFQLFENGYDTITFSSVATLSNFTSFNVPYPIITSLGVPTWEGVCLPPDAATTYEFSPFEFGSWDTEVAAFTPTQYLGTTLVAGQPTGNCIENYDNLGYILGTSSNLFNNLCSNAPTPSNTSDTAANVLASYLDAIHEVTTEDEYALYKNPFYELTASAGVSAQDTLHLVDGGEAMQNNPIFPFLQPARNISVILVNDNSADNSVNFPNGSEILQTYQQAQSRGYTRMPYIPPVSTFVSEGLNKRATFFGCDDDSVATIVYLPNVNYTYASNTPTSKLEYSKSETDGVIANGVHIASQDGDANWGTCLGCAIMKKTGQALPSDCTACFTKYCYCQS